MWSMVETGERDSDLKSKYGDVIYENFTQMTDSQIKNLGRYKIFYGVILIWGFFVLIMGLISILDLFLFGAIIYLILASILLILGSSRIQLDIINYHEYCLFESGILIPGYRHKEKKFLHFKELESVKFNKPGLEKGPDGVMFKPKGRDFEELVEPKGLVIDYSRFKYLKKFRLKILPLLRKYQIAVVDNFKESGSGNSG